MGTKRASLKFLIQCYNIAYRYRMTRLCLSYTNILIKNHLVVAIVTDPTTTSTYDDHLFKVIVT